MAFLNIQNSPLKLHPLKSALGGSWGRVNPYLQKRSSSSLISLYQSQTVGNCRKLDKYIFLNPFKSPEVITLKNHFYCNIHSLDFSSEIYLTKSRNLLMTKEWMSIVMINVHFNMKMLNEVLGDFWLVADCHGNGANLRYIISSPFVKTYFNKASNVWSLIIWHKKTKF